MSDPNFDMDFSILHDCLKIYDERKEMRPAALIIQKRKFLAALSKTKISLTEEEDKLAEEAFKEDFVIGLQRGRPLHWTDTIGTEEIKKIVEKHQKFDITLYINCAKAIFLAYSGTIYTDRDIYEAYTYVLTHARSFGDPAKNIFQFEGESDTSLSIHFDDGEISRPLSDSVYMRKITNLIEDLRVSYDDSKYRILNVNVTYLTLLILRRSVREETQFKDSLNHAKTHSDYVKLCPHPLHHQLPKVSDVFMSSMLKQEYAIKEAVTLAIHAFLTGTDELTKKVLQATCVQYMEWNGLQLPALFFKVVQLYKIEEGQLWDSLRRASVTEESLYKLSKTYYEQLKRSLAEPPETAAWFPYCRALNDSFHHELNGANNKYTCLILAYLIDLKLGFDKSFARNAHYTKKMMKEHMLKIAKQLSEEFPFA